MDGAQPETTQSGRRSQRTGSIAIAALVALGLATWAALSPTPASLIDQARGKVGLSAPKTAEPPKAAAQAGGPPGAGPGAPPAVTVAQPVKREIIEWDEYVGRFDSVESVDVRARISGYLMQQAFKDGQLVKAGDLLYQIDPRPFERTVDQARAELEQARTKASNARRDVERGRPLVERKILSERTFDERENALRDAEASIKVAEAKLKTAELDLSFTKITSPIAGRTSRTTLTTGNWVGGGNTGGASATVLTSVVSEDPIQIYFDVTEANALKYRRLIERGTPVGAATPGAPIEIALGDEKGFPHRGHLDFIDNRLDQGTGTLRARAVVANPKGLFTAGMFARVRVAGSPLFAALLLPDEAIGTDQASKFVLAVADDGAVQRRTVRLGPVVNGLRVVREGIADGDWIITKGLQRARPGGKVTPTREVIQTSDAGTPAPTAPAGTTATKKN
jgi:multidrug efflux system membrane fusion protein